VSLSGTGNSRLNLKEIRPRTVAETLPAYTRARRTVTEREAEGGRGHRVVRVLSLYSTCVSVDGAAAIAALSTLRHERDYNSIRQTGGRQSVSQVYSRLKDREQSVQTLCVCGDKTQVGVVFQRHMQGRTELSSGVGVGSLGSGLVSA